jgi:hypothetical protein
MTTATIDRADPMEGVGTVRIPVHVPGHVVEGTGGLMCVRDIRLKWEDGVPECVAGLSVTADPESLGGHVFGHERDGLPCWLMGSREFIWDDPAEERESGATDIVLWRVGVSRAFVLTSVASGLAAAILHRLPDAQYMARQLHDAMPAALLATDNDAFRAACPPYAAEWVRQTAYLLNHGVPRALIVGCKEYVAAQQPGAIGVGGGNIVLVKYDGHAWPGHVFEAERHDLACQELPHGMADVARSLIAKGIV